MDVWNPHLLSHKMDMLQNMVYQIRINVDFFSVFPVLQPGGLLQEGGPQRCVHPQARPGAPKDPGQVHLRAVDGAGRNPQRRKVHPRKSGSMLNLANII